MYKVFQTLIVFIVLGLAQTSELFAEEPGSCLYWQQYGTLHNESGQLAENYYISGFDVSPDGSFLIFAGFRNLGREIGSKTLPNGDVVGWDVILEERGLFKIDLVTNEVSVILLENYAVQGIDSPSISPDGTKVAFDARWYGEDADLSVSGRKQIFIANIQTGDYEQLTKSHQFDNPSWSPDGGRIAFETLILGEFHSLYAIGTLEIETKTSHIYDFPAMKPSWSPDGEYIVFDNYGDIGVLDMRSNQINYIDDNERWSRFATYGPNGEIIFSSKESREESFLQLTIWDGSTMTISDYNVGDVIFPRQAPCPPPK